MMRDAPSPSLPSPSRNDVTLVGATLLGVLRRTSLDELPQLINVTIGDDLRICLRTVRAVISGRGAY